MMATFVHKSAKQQNPPLNENNLSSSFGCFKIDIIVTVTQMILSLLGGDNIRAVVDWVLFNNKIRLDCQNRIQNSLDIIRLGIFQLSFVSNVNLA